MVVLLLLTLTFSTGLIDAVGYLGLDRVFTGNMTGNVVILGMAIIGADDLPVLGPLIALIGFFLGAMVGGFVLRGVESGWSRRTTALLFVVASLLIASAILLFAVSGLHGSVLQMGVTATLGFAMGVQAAAARHLAVKDVTTVVVTSTLTGLGADLFHGAAKNVLWKRRLAAVVLICAGAGVGAATLQVSLALGVALSAVISVSVAILGSITFSPLKGADSSDEALAI